MHGKFHNKEEILKLFQSKNHAIGIDYLQHFSPLNRTQLEAIVTELVIEGKLVATDKYHWNVKGL